MKTLTDAIAVGDGPVAEIEAESRERQVLSLHVARERLRHANGSMRERPAPGRYHRRPYRAPAAWRAQ